MFVFRATVDVFSGDGITPLHDAIMYGSKEQVAALVRAGADTGRRIISIVIYYFDP